MNTVLVTGANRGIGLALCVALKARGDRVVAVCRRDSPELLALNVRVESGVDIAQGAEVAQLALRLRDEHVDTLILNAGVLSEERLGAIDEAAVERIRQQFEVNALAPLRLVDALRERLIDGGKIALITSRMGSIADNGSGGYYGYRMSKAALNAAGKSLAHDLRGRRITVLVLHPGYVRTRMTGSQGDLSPEQCAANLLARIDTLGIEHSGTFWHAKGEPLPW
jgi:NAD(P)-dependent dehydrogenase (short-subunit alcohol dehydrogenase family)